MTTAKRLSSAIPDNGFIARLGGDEFIIILTNTNTDTDEIYLIEQFEMPFMIQQRQLITSVSTGIAVSPRDGIDGLKLMNYISQGAQMFSNRRKFLKRRIAGAITAKTEAVKRKDHTQ
ncbi:diguanylate cyclase domain-containing protein [Bacillus atrophaeus]|uniref:diguanylate cyclase domain-containing protein n=1 Tax=Bacillus atrophaeus TaxID=1452 RepID=UPI00398B876A